MTSKRRETVPDTAPDWSEGERIAKWLARAGVASRRDAEALIAEGRVRVDGAVLTSPAFKVTGRETVEVDGRRIEAPAPTRLWLHHKPSGRVTTHADPQGRETVFQHLPKELGRVISVGRLDLTTEGLLLLTNDGELARALELPKTGLERVYRVRAHGRTSQEALEQLALGIEVEGVAYGPVKADLERVQGGNVWLSVQLSEGKNREVRKVLEAIGLKVNRLIRVAYGPFRLGDLKPGAVIEAAPDAVADLLRRIAPKARAATPVRAKRLGAKPERATLKSGKERQKPSGPARPEPGKDKTDDRRSRRAPARNKNGPRPRNDRGGPRGRT